MLEGRDGPGGSLADRPRIGERAAGASRVCASGIRDTRPLPGRKVANAQGRERTESVVPPRITLEVMDGPMDGAIFSAAVGAVKIGRGPDNDLSLFGDRSVSNRHAALTWAEQDACWVIDDHKSTNGTWVSGARVTTPTSIELGGGFLVGNALIRATVEETTALFLPRAEDLLTECATFAKRFTPAAAQGYGAALGVAVQEGRAFLTDRHLLLGLAIANPDLGAIARGKGPMGARLLRAVARGDEAWTGAEEWIDRRLRTVGRDEEILLGSDLAITPRVLHVLRRAAEIVGDRGDELITSADLFRVMIAGVSTRLVGVLARARVDIDSILRDLDAAVDEETPATGSRVGTPVLAPVPTAGPLSSGDPAVDDRASEAARELTNVASLYHLAAPQDRRAALRSALTQAVAQVPNDSRDGFFAQLRLLFPVLAGTTIDFEGLAGRSAPAGADKAQVAVAEPAPTTAPAAAPWRLVASAEDDPQLASLAKADRAAVQLLREVLRFATAADRFIVGMVNNLTMQGRVTDVFVLPGFRTSILSFSDHLAKGKPLAPEELAEYLAAVEAWLVATTAAYHEAPEMWFREFWKKASPAAIEASLQEGGRKKVFRIEAVELWEQYRSVAQSVSPELVADEILHLVRRRAEEQFARLRERSAQS